jgi:hypothetical protein
MMNAGAAPDDLADADPNLNTDTAFTDIKWDEATQFNNVYCPVANENFRAGESVEIQPPIQITGTNYYSPVGAILRVDQQRNPQRVLLSLFLNVTPDMGINHEPPDYREYIQYPSQQVVWTRYQGWYPVTLVRREAFVVAPWEVNAGLNDTQVSCGMTNAYCVVAKWRHEILIPKLAFQPLGHDKILIPGCLNLITFQSTTQRYWSFRSTVLVKIADVLSKPSLTATTQTSVRLDCISQSHWDNFKKQTIPLENTERNGIVTTRTIRKHLSIEMLRDATIKEFARFDTVQRFNLLKAYFGGGIQGAGRIRRFSGPRFSRRTGPAPAFCARRLLNADSVGGFVELPNEPTMSYYSTRPGIDLMFSLAKRQFTIRLRFKIKKVTDAGIKEKLLGLPPTLPPVLQEVEVLLVPNESQFEHEGMLFLVRNISVDGSEVVCEVSDGGNDGRNEGDQINLPLDVVRQRVREYLYMTDDSDSEEE